MQNKANGKNLSVFHSPTLGQLEFENVVTTITKFMAASKNCHYRVIIGTDSELYNKHHADFVTAVVVHRVGQGGIYFWCREERGDMHTLRQRMWEEANYSLILAQKLITEFQNLKLSPLNLEIHVDIGTGGDTREMISEIVGMIRGNGFEVKTKPEAFGASNVADRHT